jgi:ATP-dependent Clp protease, protease subunit
VSTPFEHIMRTSGGMTGFGDMLDERLLRERIIWLEGPVMDDNSNRIAKQLQVLAAEDPAKDISLYINSPGGSITAGMVIYDTMQLIPNDVTTVAMGLAASMGQFLLCAGTAGKRYATPNTRIMMHQPSGGLGGTASDIKIQAEQMLYIKKRMAELIAVHSGQSIEQIEKDSDRDRWFTSDAARDYGLIDHVYSSSADAPSSLKGDTK